MRINTMIVALFALLGLGGAVEKANAQLVVSVGIAPPALPVYVQPPIPGPGYIWTPGYWSWNASISDYYWVPGAWVIAPSPGLLWTPGYWGWSGGAYVWNAGYWGPTVGFYGGICYGFGYTGVGFAGGYWSGGNFFYNRSVTNISNTTVINNVYNQSVVTNHTTNVSYNGGDGGVRAQPTPQELHAAKDHHIAPTQEQERHQQLASENKDSRASVNHGKPSIAAVSKAGDFSSHNVVAAHAAGAAVKPASLTSSNGSNPHAAGNLAANGGAGAIQHGASHGANKNAVANLNAGPNDKHKNPGSKANHANWAPPKGVRNYPAHHAQLHHPGPRPMAHAQPHPRPVFHAQPRLPGPRGHHG